MAFRRSVGVGHLKQKETQSKQMKEYAEQLDAESVSRAMDEVELFESRLIAFGKAHEAEIKRDPVLRARLKAVADAAGIDVLRSSRSVWSRTLGVSGKYCYDLASRVVEFCMAEARVTGSLVPLPRIVRAMQSQMPEDNVTAADVEQALAELAVFGPAYALVAPEKGVHEGYVSCQATPVAADVARLVATAVKRAKTLSAGPSIFPPAPASAAASPVVSEQDQRSLAASSTTMSTTNTGAGGAAPLLAAHSLCGRPACRSPAVALDPRLRGRLLTARSNSACARRRPSGRPSRWTRPRAKSAGRPRAPRRR
jgi:hypothetical protein